MSENSRWSSGKVPPVVSVTSSRGSQPPSSVNRSPVYVTYGRMRLTGYFRHQLRDYRGGLRVVVQTDRGTELGEVAVNHCAVCPAGGSCSKPRNSERRGAYESPVGRVLRAADDDDIRQADQLTSEDRALRDKARGIVAGRGVPLKIVEAERLLSGDRLILYFASENRVDFRELVRDLAREFGCRIEMRQIGAREEARLLGEGYGRCGEPLCCQSFLADLRNVPMKMAKTQKATLDPGKVSGRCGRLMCCLRYEDATYEELRQQLPARGTRVRTPQGEGLVLDGQVLTQLVMVAIEGQGRAAFGLESIEIIGPSPVGGRQAAGDLGPDDEDITPGESLATEGALIADAPPSDHDTTADAAGLAGRLDTQSHRQDRPGGPRPMPGRSEAGPGRSDGNRSRRAKPAGEHRRDKPPGRFAHGNAPRGEGLDPNSQPHDKPRPPRSDAPPPRGERSGPGPSRTSTGQGASPQLPRLPRRERRPDRDGGRTSEGLPPPGLPPTGAVGDSPVSRDAPPPTSGHDADNRSPGA